MASDNKSLGRFILDGIAPAPRGIPQIEVTFDVDANGILSVKAIDKATNKENSIRIEGSSGLTEEEIEKMKADAELHAEEDKKKKELVDAKNLADATVFTAEKALKDNGDKVTEETKTAVQSAIEAVNKAKEGNDMATLTAVIDTLSTTMQKIGEDLQKAGAAPESADTADVNPAGAKVEDHVRDAEVDEDTDK